MIKICNLTLRYKMGEAVFENANLEVSEGLWLLEGKNGSGKSTLLKLLGDKFDFLSKRELSIVNKELIVAEGAVYLEENINIPPLLKEIELYKIVMKINNIKEDKEYKALYDKKFCLYSNGEKKIAILKIVKRLSPKVLLLDEYLANLDEKNLMQSIEILKTMEKKGALIIVASNDQYLKSIFSSTITIKDKGFYLSEK